MTATHPFDSDWHQHQQLDKSWWTTSHQHTAPDGIGHDHPGLAPKTVPSRLAEVIESAWEHAMSSAVEHPAHYGGAGNPYEAIKVIEAWNLGFTLGNTVKCIARAGHKDPARQVEDLKKARWYLDREIDRLDIDEAVVRIRMATDAHVVSQS